MNRYVLIVAIGCGLNAFAFPKASEAESAEFSRLYRECLENGCDKKIFLSSRRSPEIYGDSYKKLLGFGPKIYELIYHESVARDVVQDVSAEGKYALSRVDVVGEGILRDLWTSCTLRYSMKYTDVDFIWTGETIAQQWEGGAAIANERASFLVKEMRIAKLENRNLDARRAMGNLQIMGVFAFPVLFGELLQGRDDVVEILCAEGWFGDDRPDQRKEGLLKWWRENASLYELPCQVGNFRGSAELEKWHRIEDKERRIRVYDARNADEFFMVNTNHTSSLTCADLCTFVGAIAAEGTNMYLRCTKSGARYRCIFNETLYGSRSNKYGELLTLPEGASLVMTNVECELTFLPVVSAPCGERGFYVVLKRDDIEHGRVLKNGFLLFCPPDDANGHDDESAGRGTDAGCKLDGVVLTDSLDVGKNVGRPRSCVEHE